MHSKKGRRLSEEDKRREGERAGEEKGEEGRVGQTRLNLDEVLQDHLSMMTCPFLLAF